MKLFVCLELSIISCWILVVIYLLNVCCVVFGNVCCVMGCVCWFCVWGCLVCWLVLLGG